MDPSCCPHRRRPLRLISYASHRRACARPQPPSARVLRPRRGPSRCDRGDKHDWHVGLPLREDQADRTMTPPEHQVAMLRKNASIAYSKRHS
ncbi:hypothetical protein BC826DRAFT_1002938 [Russula brevipes]|nr:hypothetical protein BC826DRAFT_1002938 [Russula brevipes]